jgi:hypothetical protein
MSESVSSPEPTQKPQDWSAFIASPAKLSADFMKACENLPVQVRDSFALPAKKHVAKP